MHLRRIVAAGVLGASLLSLLFTTTADARRHRCRAPAGVVQCWRTR
jgi:hypothetical protein